MAVPFSHASPFESVGICRVPFSHVSPYESVGIYREASSDWLVLGGLIADTQR